jgi:hypothetical protein
MFVTSFTSSLRTVLEATFRSKLDSLFSTITLIFSFFIASISSLLIFVFAYILK